MAVPRAAGGPLVCRTIIPLNPPTLSSRHEIHRVSFPASTVTGTVELVPLQFPVFWEPSSPVPEPSSTQILAS